MTDRLTLLEGQTLSSTFLPPPLPSGQEKPHMMVSPNPRAGDHCNNLTPWAKYYTKYQTKITFFNQLLLMLIHCECIVKSKVPALCTILEKKENGLGDEFLLCNAEPDQWLLLGFSWVALQEFFFSNLGFGVLEGVGLVFCFVLFQFLLLDDFYCLELSSKWSWREKSRAPQPSAPSKVWSTVSRASLTHFSHLFLKSLGNGVSICSFAWSNHG